MNSVRKVLYLDINKLPKRSSEQHSEKNIFYSFLVGLKHQISSKKKKNGTASFDVNSISSTKTKINVRCQVHKKLKMRFYQTLKF